MLELERFRLTSRTTAILVALVSAVAFFTNAVSQNSIDWFPLSEPTLKHILTLSLFTFAVVPLVLLFELRREVAQIPGLTHGRYYTCVARLSEYQSVVNMGMGLIGDRQPSLKQLTTLHKVNRQIVIAIFGDASRSDLKAFFILYPLTQIAREQILSGKIERASQIAPKDLSPSFGEATSIYVAMVGGKNGHAKGVVMMKMWEVLRPHVEHGKLELLFSRPASAVGQRVMRKYGFHELPPPSQISFKNIDTTFSELMGLRRSPLPLT